MAPVDRLPDGQGYLFAKPVPAGDFRTVLTTCSSLAPLDEEAETVVPAAPPHNP